MLVANTILQNRYQIIRQLGAGGMGAVYLALDRKSQQNVAIKESQSIDPATIAQFQTEAEILALASHPNLPGVIDHFVLPSGPQYLVMEYIEGQNLEELVQQLGALSEQDAFNWMIQIFDAVKYLHNHHVIHRDINPRNIIVTIRGQAVLVDFGIAKIASLGQVTSAAARGMGTPGYAPPEQYGGGTDERTDIYALGATLYFLLTATVPPESNLRAARQVTLVSPRRINPAISLETEKAILTAMKWDIRKRFSSVDEFEQALPARPAQDIRRVFSQPTAVVAPDVITATTVPQAATQRNSILFLAIGFSILVGGALVVILLGLFTANSGPTTGGAQTQAAPLAPSATWTETAKSAAPSAVPVAAPSATSLALRRLDPVIGVAYDEQGHPFEGATAVQATHLDTGNQTQILLTSGFVSSAVWSQDGNKILVSFWGIPYGPDRYDVRVLRLVNADGSDGTDIAKSDPHGGDRFRGFVDAIWSPNGQLMAFLREEFGNSCVYTMRTNGDGLNRLDGCEANDDPRYWSVDGKWIVVRAQRGGFYALDANGGQRLSLENVGRIQMYDERYYPWKVVEQPACSGADFWSCE